MEVRSGYKQTEVGVIPEDWDSSKLGDHAFVTKLAGFEYTLHFDYSKSGPIIAIRALNIKGGTLCLNEVHTIPKETSDDLPRSKLKKGDLVMSYVGTLGRVAVIPEDDRFHLAPNVAKLSVNRQVLPAFLGHFLNGSQGQKSIFDAAASTTQAALSMRNLRELFFARPRLAEQEAIAEALSDADALIDCMEQLLAKKRDLKQGAMQELLTGKKRLPGFSGEWEVKRLGDVLTIAHGKSQHSVADRNGAYPILATGGQIGTANRFLYDKPSVLIGRKGTIDEPQFMDTPFWTVDTLFYSIVHEPNDAKFLYYRFCLIDWKQHNEASGVPSLNARTIERIEITIPQQQEQTAIAAVLSDMDAEIAVLETKLAKARGLKQGMMHKLLMGAIRLPVDGAGIAE